MLVLCSVKMLYYPQNKKKKIMLQFIYAADTQHHTKANMTKAKIKTLTTFVAEKKKNLVKI